jgi:hypothetical protein
VTPPPLENEADAPPPFPAPLNEPVQYPTGLAAKAGMALAIIMVITQNRTIPHPMLLLIVLPSLPDCSGLL